MTPRIVRDINAVPVVKPPSRDEMIAAALMKAAPRLKVEPPAAAAAVPTFTTAAAMEPHAIPTADPSIVDVSVTQPPPREITQPPPPQAAPAIPIVPVSSPTFPMPVPSVNSEQSAPRRTVINLECYKKKRKMAATIDTAMPCDLTVPPPTSHLPTVMNITSEIENLARRDPRLRKK